ncbi:MAG: hypothetical protein M3137_12075 [Actinomycetota bacterium]|nr:hypothetical protein [Actinomycetota bacterium]
MTGAVRRGLRRVYGDVPAVRPLMRQVRRVLIPPHFSGWGMATDHADPWDDPAWANFGQAQEDMSADVEHGLLVDTDVSAAMLHELRWRHWIVAFCVRYALSFERAAGSRDLALVECGVGDGLSAYFACHEAKYQVSRSVGVSYVMHCYDVWGPMAEADLLPTERLHRNGYANSSLERTRRNLRRFGEGVIFHPGHVPESFEAGPAGLSRWLTSPSTSTRPSRPSLRSSISFPGSHPEASCSWMTTATVPTSRPNEPSIGSSRPNPAPW